MEIHIRLTGQDMQTEGVFDALKQMCLCFDRSKEDRFVKVKPPAPKGKAHEQTAAADTAASQNAAPAAETKPDSAAVKPIPKQPTAAPAKEYTLDEVRDALREYSKTNGANAAKAILTSLDVSRVTELSPDKYGAAMAAMGAVK